MDILSPIRAIRLSAIEEAINSGDTPEILDALRKQKELEKDADCLNLLDQAIGVVEKRLSRASEAPEALSPETFFAKFAAGNQRDKIVLLSGIPRPLIKALSPQIPDYLATESDPSIQALLIRTFGRQWPRERLRELLVYVKHPILRAAALEILVQLAPDSLKRDLPKFLVHQDPRLRALAIRCLAKIDFQETLAHFEGLLNSQVEGEKLTAIENCSFFPFDQIKSFLIKFLIFEQQLPFIERVGIILGSNPDPEVPFRLWEIAESATGKKRAAILEIAKECYDHIEKAGILGENFPRYLQQLKDWIQEKKQRKWAQEIINILNDPESWTEETQAFLFQSLQQDFQRKALEKALEWPVTDHVKKNIHLLLQGKPLLTPQMEQLSNLSLDDILTGVIPEKNEKTAVPQAKAPAAQSKIQTSEGPGPKPDSSSQAGSLPSKSPADEKGVDLKIAGLPFSVASPEEQIRRLASLSTEDLVKLKGDLEKIAASVDTPPDLLSSCLRAGLRMESPFLVPQARKGLKHADSRVTVVALEYLGKHDVDWVFPYIGQFLKNKQSRVKVAAIKVLRQQDQQTSLSNLKNLLHLKDGQQNRTALACLVYFDFPAVRDLLFQFLLDQKDNELIQSGLTLFGTNPEPDNLFLLFRLEKTLPEPSGQLAKKVRRESENFLVTSGQLPTLADNVREEEYQKKLRQLEERSAKPQESYSYQRLSKLSRIETIGDVWDYISENSFGKGKEGLYSFVASGLRGLPESRELMEDILKKLAIRYAFPMLVMVLLLIGVGVYAFSQEARFEENPRRGPVLSLPKTVQGKVEQVKGFEITLKADDGKTYLIQRNSGIFSKNLLNVNIKALVVPFRVVRENVFESNLQSMEKLNK